MGFSRQEYWSGLPFPSPKDLPDPGIKLHCKAILYHLNYREVYLLRWLVSKKGRGKKKKRKKRAEIRSIGEGIDLKETIFAHYGCNF